jgi:hypothetical protein
MIYIFLFIFLCSKCVILWTSSFVVLFLLSWFNIVSQDSECMRFKSADCVAENSSCSCEINYLSFLYMTLLQYLPRVRFLNKRFVVKPIFTYLLTYLFTWEVVPHGPGRASQGTSAPGCSRFHPVCSRASLLGAAQLVGSQLFVGSLENLTHFQSFHLWWNLVPILNHSQAEEISAHVQPSMSHSNVQWVCTCPGWPCTVSGHLKPCLWVEAPSALEDFMDHAHISLVSPFFQGWQVQLEKSVLVGCAGQS